MTNASTIPEASPDALLSVLARLADRLERPAVLPLLLGAEDAAAFVGLSRTAFFAAASGGEFPTVETPAGRKWRRADLERWVSGLKPARTASRRGGFKPRKAAAATVGTAVVAEDH